MQLELFRTLWGYDRSWQEAIAELRHAGFDGIEARVPENAAQCAERAALLAGEGVPYIAIILTAYGVLPDQSAGIAAHVEDFRRKLDLALPMSPRFLNILGGNDRWPVAQQVEFIARVQEACAGTGLVPCFETHRARILSSPWITLDVIAQHPETRFTADISHWVVGCERLLNDPADDFSPFIARVHHVQARVGYDQGPQVPHPAAPEYAAELAFHQSFWSEIWDSQRARGHARTTMTPEFGPDGYLQRQPFTGTPVADLWELNQWMGRTERERFARHCDKRRKIT